VQKQRRPTKPEGGCCSSNRFLILIFKEKDKVKDKDKEVRLF
jgi:hypothetical protein